jgi:hypothetical protein
MAVTSCTLIREGDMQSSFTRDRLREYNLTYHIKTNSVMGPISVQLGALAASPNALPDLWDTYSALGDSDNDAYCDKCDLKRKPADPKLWTANLHFSTLQPGQDPGQSNVSPLLRPIRYRGQKMVATRPIVRDKDGNLVVNSALEEFDEPLEGETVYPMLIATRNIASLTQWISDLATFLHSVNSSGYRSQAARTWWCADIELSDIIYEDGTAYFQETWSLAFNPDLWDERLLDRGWKVLNDESPAKKVNATDDKGKLVQEPVLLNGFGKKLATGANPVARVFRVKRENSWATMPV